MLPPSLDLRVRCKLDPRIGSLVTVGIGSRQTDLLTHEQSALAPLSRAAATALVTDSVAGPALAAADLDPEVVIDAVVRIARLASANEAITLLDVNPLMVSAGKAWVADADLEIAAADDHGPLRRID
jgi:acetyl-CoA synthetase (ADP-forming)